MKMKSLKSRRNHEKNCGFRTRVKFHVLEMTLKIKSLLPVTDPAAEDIIGTQSSLSGLKLSSDLRLFKMDLGNSWSWSSSSSVLFWCRFFKIDLIPSMGGFEPEVRSSRLPWPLLEAPALFFKIDETAPAIQ